MDGNVKIQFSLIFSFTFNLSLTNSQLSLHILGHLEENSKFLLCEKGA